MELEMPTWDQFGLAGTFPRPGWVVLDAARDHRFTGEIVLHTLPEVRMYFDRGRIYLAERVNDPSLGSRLVDAGALNAAQLEHGSIHTDEGEHIGRLFERVPSVDRHGVLVISEMMTDECVGWIAGQRIGGMTVTPYKHHPSGAHRWDRPPGSIDLCPGDPLPAPAPHESPVQVSQPEPLFSPLEDDHADEMISWSEPGWLDERMPRRGRGDASATDDSPAHQQSDTAGIAGSESADLVSNADWIDRLEDDGLPDAGSDPLAAGMSSTTRLPQLPPQPVDRFEVIWPTGEIDEEFGGAATASIADHHPDLDRAGPTARLSRVSPHTEPVAPAESEVDVALPTDDDDPDDDLAGDLAGDVAANDVVLAVRRAVASIETGSLTARRRLADAPTDDDLSRGIDPIPPGRVAVRTESSEWASGGLQGLIRPPIRSVFDEASGAVVEPSAAPDVADPPEVQMPVDDEPTSRTGALRRLIQSLRPRS